MSGPLSEDLSRWGSGGGQGEDADGHIFGGWNA